MGRSRATPLILFFLAALLLPAAGARGDLFDILVQDIGGSGVPDLQVGGSSLPQLIEDLINAQGDFSPFAGIPFSASITFAGVPNAIAITVDPTTQTATLSFPILGPGAQVFNFTGTDLFGQIEQFLQDNFAEQLTLFLNAINALALVAVTDGTPLSTTALSANYVFDRFGLHADLTRWERRLADEDAGRPGVRGRIDTYYESIDTDVGDGTAITIAPSLEWVLNDMISVAFQFPIAYHKIEGADILNVHGNLAVPLTFLSPDAGNPWGLRLTPFGSLAGVGSIDMASGGLIAGGGVIGTATLASDTFQVSVSGQISFHEGLILEIEDFKFDPGVSQQIAKIGVKGTQYFGDSLYVYGSFVYSSFLQDAAINDYITPGAGFGYRLANGLNISGGYSGDIADGYQSHQLRMTFQLPF